MTANDNAKHALRLRMERGRHRRLVLVAPEEVLALLDEIEALRAEVQARGRELDDVRFTGGIIVGCP